MNDQGLLDSWKKISEYLGREVRTCINWEKELGLPIHRLDPHSSRSRVFTYKSEIDAWLKERARDNPKKGNVRGHLWERKWLFWGSVLLSVTLAALLILQFYNAKRARSHSSRETSLAILPFESPNSSASDVQFAENIAIEIATKLAMSGRMKILPPYLFFGDKTNESRILKKLGADFVLRGKGGLENDRFRLSVTLVNARKEESLWGAEYSDRLENILYVQDTIGRSLVALLNPRDNSGHRSSAKEGNDPQQILNDIPVGNPLRDQASQGSKGPPGSFTFREDTFWTYRPTGQQARHKSGQ